MRHTKFTAPLAVLVLSCINHAANAQSWLGGASVGQAKQFNYTVGGPIANAHSADTAMRAFGGYMFNGWAGAVLSYVDLGSPKYDGPAWGGFNDSLKASAVDLSVLLTFTPGDQHLWGPFISIGTFQFSQDVHYRDASGTYDYHDTGTRLSYGAGVRFNVGKAWGVHFGWQRFNKVGDERNSGHEYNRDVMETGFEYRFGL
jgi:hypothetical protein